VARSIFAAACAAALILATLVAAVSIPPRWSRRLDTCRALRGRFASCHTRRGCFHFAASPAALSKSCRLEAAEIDFDAGA